MFPKAFRYLNKLKIKEIGNTKYHQMAHSTKWMPSFSSAAIGGYCIENFQTGSIIIQRDHMT